MALPTHRDRVSPPAYRLAGRTAVAAFMTSFWLLTTAPAGSAGELGFLEDFALAPDRPAALRQLIPGTEEYYYFHCLHALNTEQFEQITALTGPWRRRFGQTPRLTEIENRQALLGYEKDPGKSLTYLRDRLGLRYDHRQIVPAAEAKLPAALDPSLISGKAVRATSLDRWSDLRDFEDRALESLAAEELTWARRREVLRRLSRPDVPNLPALIAADLRSPNAQPFGSYPIHDRLTLDQLGDLVRLRPELLNDSFLVTTWAKKLHPGADQDWRGDAALTRAYLDRLEGFVNRLGPVHNGLRANVLYHRLAVDRSQGVYDRDRFVSYLRLPRRLPYVAPAHLQRAEALRFPADLAGNYSAVTLLPPVGTDEPLVREYLKHFLETADSAKDFEGVIESGYLRRLFAEVKIEGGFGDPERWASVLPPDDFRRLRERVDIDFAPTNKTRFGADDPVRLDLFVKNVPSLLVRVFEINTGAYYRARQHEVQTDINLDGLVSNSEQKHEFPEAPFRRVPRRFEFPGLNKPGVYVIDFIGSGKSSRAVVRKGRLRAISRTASVGQLVTVVDDANRPVNDATLWLGGQEYKPDDTGRLTVPFTASPGRRPVVLSRGEFSCLDAIDHVSEHYSLHAAFHVDRETLLKQKVAPVIVRPRLLIGTSPVPVSRLEDVKLRLVAVDQDAIPTATEVPGFPLSDGRESVYEFRVPARLATLTMTVTAKIKSLATGEFVDLAAADTVTVNGIDRSDRTEDLYLTRFGPDYVIEVLGRTGEPKRDRIVQLAFKHRDYKEPVHVSLKTDGDGRLTLGALADITTVTATGPESTRRTWELSRDHHTYPPLIQAKSGDVVVVPYLGSVKRPERSEVALFELRGDVIRADRFDSLAIRNGMVEARGLEPGDYELWLKDSGTKIRVRVADGPVVAGYVLGSLRHLELPAPPLHIQAVDVAKDDLIIRLRNASKFARVHVFAGRYLSEATAYRDLSRVRGDAAAAVYPSHPESVYLTGRDIGDEYRYVLDRRGLKKYPGVMLDRPQLLLNPWAVRPTEAGERLAREGGEFQRKRAPEASRMEMSAGGKTEGKPAADGAPGVGSPDLDFLAEPAAVAVNLVPDKDGVVRLSRKVLGAHAVVQVVAVDPESTTSRTVALPEPPRKFLDLRLQAKAGLDPNLHFTRQKQVRLLAPGEPIEVADVTSGRFEAYDSLAKVYHLYFTLTRDEHLAEFSFLLKWPKLKPAEKRETYSKYACHELNVFLMKKDPKFFADVVKPYLANKKDKTFIDRWLLGEDQKDDLRPWSFSRLNTAERAFLAQRLPGEPERTSRDLEDTLRLQRRDRDRERMLFDTAVRRASMNVNLTEEDIGLDPDVPLNYEKARMEEVSVPGPADSPAGDPTGGSRGGIAGGFRGGIAGGMGGGNPATRPLAALTTEALDAAKKDESGRALKKAGPSMLSNAESERDGKRAAGSPDVQEQVAEVWREKYGNKPEHRDPLVRQLYRRIGPTMELAENNYYQLLMDDQNADLIPPNRFWVDYTRHDNKRPFVSRHLAEASQNFTEMVLALAVLDLPFESPENKVVVDGTKMTFTPAGPAVAFVEEVRPAAGPPAKSPALVSQDVYRADERFRTEDGEKVDNFVTDEFVTQAVYGCQVVVANQTSSPQKLSVLIQLPVGAVPVRGAQYTRSVAMDLEPFRTQTLDYYFYFPFPGRYAMFPAHAARDERLLAAARPVTFTVVAKPSKPDTSSWAYVSQHGTDGEVMAFLDRENVRSLDLDLIAFRLREKPFFARLVRVLEARHVYHPTVWSYGLFHDQPGVIREYLRHADEFVASLGGPVNTPLLTVDPVARRRHEHLEYKPLVNARAHALGKRREIVNEEVFDQYERLLRQLTYHRRLDDTDRLAVVYYLLLQDRVAEALKEFAEVRREAVATKIQYDSCAAYLSLCTGDTDRARAVAAKYADYPVDRWKNAFAAVVSQVDEAEGKGPKVNNPEDRDQQQGKLAATEPAVEFTVEGGEVTLSWQNLDSVRVNYYLMDVELLFSRNPFVRQVSGPFGAVRPNASQVVKLPAGKTRLSLRLPEELVRKNVLVEVVGGPVTRSHPWMASALDVRVTENYGQVRVTDTTTGKPAARVYVKVYARLRDGTVKFHHDGYTDLRGRFDYATVSGAGQQPVAQYAVFVTSEDRGAVLREVRPPQQ